MNRVGARGARRKVEWETAKAAHRAQNPDCEGPKYLEDHTCWGPLDTHHVVARGSGGGHDYGIYVTACRKFHDHIEMNRAWAKSVGLLKSFWEVDNEGGE